MNPSNVYDVIIVGGGIAGLTAAAYIAKEGFSPLIIEQQDEVGGLINSFDYDGFIFDGGIRSIENSGVTHVVMKDLNLKVDMIKSHVTLGIDHQVIDLNTQKDLKNYEDLLISIFPESKLEIQRIFKEIDKIIDHMNVLYGIDNPMIVDIWKNKKYALSLIPWLFKFIPTLYKIQKLSLPVETFLSKYTKNQALIDMISQHFFKNTPTFFALGYFSIYFDYYYPKGGTGTYPKALSNYILTHGGKIINQRKVTYLDLTSHQIKDHLGHSYSYKQLIWASDIKHLYHSIDMNVIKDKKLVDQIRNKKDLLKDSRGAESVLTVYATTSLDPSYFKNISSEHFFYTPKTDGLSQIKLPLTNHMDELIEPLTRYYDLNTYEISIPSLRDPHLSPKGKTGIIISILFDYDTIKHISNQGFYDDFKKFTESYFIEVLSKSIYPKLKDHVLDTFCSTPLTFEKRTSNTDGALFGFSYRNQIMPSEHKMSRITKSIDTPLKNIYQIGQWTFSPAGVPISMITGKLASKKVIKYLKKHPSH